MQIVERIQGAIYALEVGRAARWLRISALVTTVVALAVVYDVLAYHNFSTMEAMDAAQVGRNIAEGRGFTTEFIRPFSLYLVQKYNKNNADTASTNFTDYAQINTGHPDLANAPAYPLLLAGWMKIFPPEWRVQTRKPFWSERGSFARYEPEFRIALLNQLLLMAVVALTFLLAKTLFDWQAAWLSAAIVLGSDVLWKFSVSGLSTMLMMVVFLGLCLVLAKIEILARDPKVDSQKLLSFALAAGALTALGMMTRYSFGWLILPVAAFLGVFGGVKRGSLPVAAGLIFLICISPWIARNLMVSGTYFGTAGYAMSEDIYVFPGTQLMRSLSPDTTSLYWMVPYERKFLANSRALFQEDLPRFAGWMSVLFFAGLLLRLRQTTGSRLRHFTLMSLVVLFLVQVMGRTPASAVGDINGENVLILILPLAVIFGVVFFLTMLAQLELPTLQVRLGLITILLIIVWQPLFSTLLPPRTPPVAYPPYYPPDIQKISAWMQEDELMMSDVPWAVAWYGRRQCVWNTINSQYTFFQLNDWIKPVRGVYFTPVSADAKIISESLQGGTDNWKLFVLKTLILREPLPSDFPLKVAPSDTLLSGLFLTDRVRW